MSTSLGSFPYIVLAVLGLAILMIVHETGHFLSARAFGMRVTRFSIGFGPTIFRIVPENEHYWFVTGAGRVRFRLFRHNAEKHGSTIYQVCAIPFLAYVQIAGMNPFEEVDPHDKGSYANASLIGRIITILGGPLANYLCASVFFFGAFYVGGKYVPTTDVEVFDGTPAKAANLQSGDKVIEIQGRPINEWSDLVESISKHPGEPLQIVVDRKGERFQTTVTPRNDEGIGRIGVQSAGEKHLVIGAREAAFLAVRTPAVVVKDQLEGLGQLIRGKAKGELTGPVGMVKTMVKAAQRGIYDLTFLLGFFSALLGAFNLIPFPALDGGRLLFLGYEAATRRRPNARVEAQIHAVGLVMMLSLIAYVTIAKDLSILK